MIKTPATPWIAAAVLAVASPAAARTVIAPPGDSASSQYVEVVPTAGGPGVAQGGAPSSQVLSSAQTRRLDSHGAAGRALVALVNGTAPSSPSATARPLGVGASRAAAAAPRAAPVPVAPRSPLARVKAQSAAASVAAAAIGRGGGGLGALLPVAIVMAVLGLVIGAVRRLRSQG